MLRFLALAAAFLAAPLAAPLAAQQIVADLSQSRVAITASFDGSEILVFGAIKHDRPQAEDEKLDVIITISGPRQPVMVRRKERIAGIWVNNDAVEVDEAPSFYAIATTGPLAQILSETSDTRHRISIPKAIRLVGLPEGISDRENFLEALVRIRTDQELYQLREGAAALQDNTLFRANVALPANLVEGRYTTQIYLARDRQVIGTYATAINVRKVGLERWIYTLAHERPLIYGLLSLAIAIAAGWSASAVFRYIRS